MQKICIITMMDFNYFIYRVSFSFIQNEEVTRSIIPKQFRWHKFWQFESYRICSKIFESLFVSTYIVILSSHNISLHELKLASYADQSIKTTYSGALLLYYGWREGNCDVCGITESFT